MTPILRYGVESQLSFESCENALVGQGGSPSIEPVADVRAEVRRALAEPLDYPPFSAMVTPGDRVVLAVADETPGLAEIVAAVVKQLIESRVDPEAIMVLRAGGDSEDPCRDLPESLRSQVVSAVHDPEEADELAYLATTEQGEAILLNRAIVDADVVVPIGCFRGGSAAGYSGIHSPVYPAFSNKETRRRFRAIATLDSTGRHRKRLVKEADEVGWLLGIALTIQVIPAPGERVYEVLAGQVDAVRHRGMELYSRLWREQASERTGLVVAGLEGNSAQQTWENLGRALETALLLVEEGGALALCTELDAAPGEGIQCLRSARTREEALQQIHVEEPADAVTAIQLARALDHCSVYLLSRLDDALVEDLEMTPVDEASDLARLAGRFESVFLLGNASYAQVTVDPDLGS